MKSKALILIEQIDKIFEERGLKVKMSRKKGHFAYVPPQKCTASNNNKLQNQERN